MNGFHPLYALILLLPALLVLRYPSDRDIWEDGPDDPARADDSPRRA